MGYDFLLPVQIPPQYLMGGGNGVDVGRGKDGKT